MKYYAHLNSAVSLVNSYNGQQPFHQFLKNFFKENKKHGSSDRRNIAHLCYCYFRMGNSLTDTPVEEKMIAGLFLCSSKPNEVLKFLRPELNESLEQNLSLEEKILLINQRYPHFQSIKIFNFQTKLSEGIDGSLFTLSHLVQPDLFIRIRPGNKDHVMMKLRESKIDFTLMEPFSIRLPSGYKIEELVEINKEAAIQDYSSQRTGNFLPPRDAFHGKPAVWDCCAASGGKAMMAYDFLNPIDLTVTDIRESILINLRNRFKQAGINNFRSFVTDLAINKNNQQFDLIIADVPCTGSGTWGRAPENLCFFKDESLRRYADLQKNILKNISSSVKQGGYLLYITCSIFREENENIVEYISQESGLSLVRKEVIKGYDQKADTMFAALLKRI